MPSIPKPTPFIVSQAVVTGLSIPAIQIDPRLNFVRGAFIFASDIDRMSMSFKSWKEPLQEARDTVVIPSVYENFAAEGRPKWKPLLPQTLQNRMYMGFPRGPILLRTGRLAEAATRKSIWEITSAVGREGYDMLKLRTAYLDQLAPYAEFHQLGAGMRRGRRTGDIRMRFSGTSPPLIKPTQFRHREVNPVFGDTRTFRLPPRPFIQLTTDEEAEIYSIFFAFMMRKVEQYWGPDVEGLGLF